MAAKPKKNHPLQMFESESHYKTIDINESQNLQAHSSEHGQDAYHRGPLVPTSVENTLNSVPTSAFAEHLVTEIPSKGHRRHATSVSALKQPSFLSANFAKRKLSVQRSPKKGH